jgi:hypothetical protein
MKIVPGSKVAYSVQFLKSIGESHGEIARARGVVTAIVPLGTSTKIAEIQWTSDMPKRVNVANLAIVGPNRKFCNVD